jgi:small subunit ribosomal protein S20
MPHTHTAKKRGRQSAKRRLHNRAVKKAIKIQIKTVFDAAKSSPDKLQAEIKAAIKKLDKAAAKRVIHPNTAARKKSQLARLGNAPPQPAAPTSPA